VSFTLALELDNSWSIAGVSHETMFTDDICFSDDLEKSFYWFFILPLLTFLLLFFRALKGLSLHVFFLSLVYINTSIFPPLQTTKQMFFVRSVSSVMIMIVIRVMMIDWLCLFSSHWHCQQPFIHCQKPWIFVRDFGSSFADDFQRDITGQIAISRLGYFSRSICLSHVY